MKVNLKQGGVHCANCEFWQMFDDTCSHPLSERLWQYTPPQHEICEYFEEEKI